MLANIENLLDTVNIVEKLENRKDGDSGFFGTYFDKDEED